MEKIHKALTYSTFFLTLFYLSACVPARQFQEQKKKAEDLQNENNRLKAENQDLITKNTELLASVEKMTKDVSNLVADSLQRGENLHRLTSLYNELTKSYDKLLANNEKLLAGNTEETKKLIAQLGDTRVDLQRKEDEVNRQRKELAEREEKLNQMEKKVAELQSILSKKDSVVKSLKDAVSNALLGFVNQGLSVDIKNGKVYVSMEERLLFASGSTVVDKRGEEALKELAKVLENQKDINIMVEGHTDEVPISGTLPSGAKDNWELSVLRATSVVKILSKYSGIDPGRITAAGRGPYFPLDTSKTAEARRKNRRTEIILTPKLDELLKVLESN